MRSFDLDEFKMIDPIKELIFKKSSISFKPNLQYDNC